MSSHNVNEVASSSPVEEVSRAEHAAAVVGDSIPSSTPIISTSTPNPELGPGTPIASSTAPDLVLPENAEIVDTSKLKSDVWKHMIKIKINGPSGATYKGVCNYCKTQLAANADSGTRHLSSHINVCLKKRKRTLPEPYQKLLLANRKGDGKTTINNYTFDQDLSRKDLVEMIIMHEHPLSIVGQVGFKRFVGNLQPLFKIPTRNTVRKDVLKLYKDMMKSTMDKVDANEGRVAITTDMWTADNQKKGYMAVTAHFIDSSWRLQQRIIRFCHVPTPHTVDVIANQLYDILLDWNLDNKLSTITVDNCSVNDGVVQCLVDKIDNSNLLLSGSVLHMRCCAHILNLIVKDGLDVIGPTLEKIRDSCVFWTGTPKRIENFEETARQLHINSTKKLCYDVKTRWNSTFVMLETALIYKDVFPRLKRRDAQYKIDIGEEDWENAKMLSEKLYLFFKITELFSGSKYTTANQYFPNICNIRKALISWQSEGNLTVASMASKMLEKFEKYWSEVHGIMGIATLLDPRFKVKLLEFLFKQIYGSNYMTHVNKIVNLCRDLIREYQIRGYNEEPNETYVRGDNGEVDSDDMRVYYEWVVNDEGNKKPKSSSQLDVYLEEKIVITTPDFNVLNWWKEYGSQFPTLQKIARDIYAIPVSTVASESAFSMGGRLISPQRNRLRPDLVEALACAQNWLKAELEAECPEDTHLKTYFDDSDDDDGVESTITAA